MTSLYRTLKLGGPIGAKSAFREMGMPHTWSMKVCIPHHLPGGHEIFAPLAKKLGFQLIKYETIALADELFETYPALFVAPVSFTLGKETIRRARDKVSAFATISTGTDHVDFDALREAGISFFHAPGINSRSVVEYVLCALPYFFEEARLLDGKLTVGIVGYGRIGGMLGSCLEKLGIEHVHHDPFLNEHSRPLSEILDADIVTIHTPLTDKGVHPTRHMFNVPLLKRMSAGSILFNTARGGVFDKEGYNYACEHFQCLMDVFPEEPPDTMAVRAPKIVSPHVAGYNHNARVEGCLRVARSFLEHMGEDPDLATKPEEGVCEIYVTDFLTQESRLLKNDPASFSKRRHRYPRRGNLHAAARFLPEHRHGDFPQKLIQTLVDTK